MTGAWAGAGFLADGVRGWVLGMAGFGVFYLPECGAGSSSPQVPGHSSSMCDAGVNGAFVIFLAQPVSQQNFHLLV